MATTDRTTAPELAGRLRVMASLLRKGRVTDEIDAGWLREAADELERITRERDNLLHSHIRCVEHPKGTLVFLIDSYDLGASIHDTVEGAVEAVRLGLMLDRKEGS